ncbi:MAG TPA: hypothetical protein VLK23_02020, partial [Thermodesulfobacteriota bacterium]|nr:hypothetical protein [Thermodesulfobacteriota bacterium]
MIKKILVKKNQYRDSVFLMVINERARSFPGVSEVAVMMGTDNNKEMMKEVGLIGPEIDSAAPNDLVICIQGKSKELTEKALSEIEGMLIKKPRAEEIEDVYKTLESALRERPDTNLAIISVPG